MKTKLIPVVLLVAIVCSCTKTKTVTNNVTITDTVTAIETPAYSIITKFSIVDTLPVFPVGSGSYEIGSEFYASDSGVITKLGCLCPVKDSTYKVSLWDFNSNTLLASANVTCADSTHFSYVSITPVYITANKNYIISYNNTVGGVGQGYYFPSLKSQNPLAFPFSDGSITFVNSYYVGSTSSVFPTSLDNNFIASADFVFQVK
jgi:hypothetical protein